MKPGDLAYGDVFGSYLYVDYDFDYSTPDHHIQSGVVSANELVIVITSSPHRDWVLVLTQRGCLGWTSVHALERT